MNAVAFFLHPQMVRSTVQQLHFSRFSALAWPSAPWQTAGLPRRSSTSEGASAGKSSHLLQLTPQFWFPKALALEPPNNPVESGALRDAVTPRPRASSPRRCSPTAMRWILTQPSMARAIPYGRSSLTTEVFFFQSIGLGETRWHHYSSCSSYRWKKNVKKDLLGWEPMFLFVHGVPCSVFEMVYCEIFCASNLSLFHTSTPL